MIRPVLTALLLAGPASAATITALDAPGFNSTPLSVTVQNRSPECGNGKSVINDGCAPATKDGKSPAPFGRFNPSDPGGAWLDSQDMRVSDWTFTGAEPIRELRFSLTDLCDQRGSKCAIRVLDEPGETWRIAGNRENGVVDHFSILLDSERDSVTMRVTALKQGGGRRNDGYGVTPSPIPLPAAVWLILAGVGAIFGVKRMRRAA